MTTTGHLIALLEWATGPDKKGNPYCHKAVKDALTHLGEIVPDAIDVLGEVGLTVDADALARAAGEDIPSAAVVALGKVRAGLRCNYDAAIIAREFGAEIDDALGGPDCLGPLGPDSRDPLDS